MRSRLVLGSGSVALTLLAEMRSDGDELVVVTDDEHQASALREDGVAVEMKDPTDPTALAELEIDPDTVAVASDDPDRNLAVTTVAVEAFPAAFTLAYAGADPTRTQLRELSALADRIVDPATAITDRLGQVVGGESTRVRQLQRVLRDLDTMAVVTHDNPDPDAIASAVALGLLAERAGCEATLCYYGAISHQENRAFVNLLEYDLVELDPDDPSDLDGFDGFALVDHSRPGVNDQLPDELDIDIVIDHHPPRAPVEGRFVDLRSGVGATSTLLVDYLRQFGVDIPEAVATGLLFGIRVDTKDFEREVSAADFEAAAHLVPRADMAVLQRIEDPSVSGETLSVIARAITNRQMEGSVLLSCVGELSDRDALAQAADRLLDMEDVQATLVYGVLDGTIYASARARGTDIDLGEVLRDAFGQIGSAGGHADMAGAQITLGVLDSIDDREESLHEIVTSVVTDRFLDAVESRSHRLLGTVYGDSAYGPEAVVGPPVDPSPDEEPTDEGGSGSDADSA
ncbi:DHH family phosphoesterase [Haloarcula pelagica]|uniref:DHH family phosphoesterase n=1 Tax=Haloarcula pelagica TaxID=3033389 RepID=UPI0024C21052|nr:DHH family phosphoesterase [Halomicroarcula sp. YJ-61-S]